LPISCLFIFKQFDGISLRSGLDTFADHPEDASDYLFPLLKFAASHIPPQQHKETLLYILATAGMRLLSEEYVNFSQDI